MVSHGERWRASCPARGVTHLAIGSSGWLGVIFQKPPLPKLINRTSTMSPTLTNAAPLSKTFLKRRRLRTEESRTTPNLTRGRTHTRLEMPLLKPTSLPAASGRTLDNRSLQPSPVTSQPHVATPSSRCQQTPQRLPIEATIAPIPAHRSGANNRYSERRTALAPPNV